MQKRSEICAVNHERIQIKLPLFNGLNSCTASARVLKKVFGEKIILKADKFGRGFLLDNRNPLLENLKQ